MSVEKPGIAVTKNQMEKEKNTQTLLNKPTENAFRSKAKRR